MTGSTEQQHAGSALRNDILRFGSLLVLLLFALPLLAFSLLHKLYLVTAGALALVAACGYGFYKGQRRAAEFPEREFTEREVALRHRLYPVASILGLVSFSAAVYFSIYRLADVALLFTVTALVWAGAVLEKKPEKKINVFDWIIVTLCLIIPMYMLAHQFGFL